MLKDYRADVPRAIKELIPPLVQLHPLSVELLFQNECTTTHLFDGFLDLTGRSLAEHGSERAEELNLFVLHMTSTSEEWVDIKFNARTSALSRFLVSQSSHATFLRSEQVL